MRESWAHNVTPKGRSEKVMATIFVNPGWNTDDDPITVYVLNGYVYMTDPGTGSSTALWYNKLGENNYDTKGAVFAASDGDTIYVYNDSADFLSLSTPSGTYCPPGLYELYLNRSTASQKNLAVWANKLQLW
jgi:myo-inositol-hexaphosphate 3-phosphohydrolase